jgi:putative ATP-binding cassette transporter
MLIELVNKEEPGSWVRIIVAAAISGMANAATLALVNSAARSSEQAGMATFALFLAAVVAFLLGLRYSVGRTSRNIESALCRMRIELANWIRRAELLGLEQIGTAEIYERLTEQTSILSSSAWPLALGLQGAVMLACTIFYLAVVSLNLLLITLGVYALAALYHVNRQPRMRRILHDAAGTRMRLFGLLNDFIDGFKEVRLRTQRSDALHAEFGRVATSLKDTTVASNLLSQENFVFGQVLQLSLMGAAVFVLPQFTETDTHATMASISALLLILAPLSHVLYAVPAYERADLAAENIVQLQQRLQESASKETTLTTDDWAGQPFSEMRLSELEFRRLDANGQEVFAVGPISLTIRAGEIVFLVGGNGSGKTTLLRTITTLYPPTAGTLSINGVTILPHNRQAYREMITAIFSDFHLFRKLYGIANGSSAELRSLLEKFQLSQKTQLIDDEWKTIDLSTGQRKRLAMVTALLEDRPIYVFDEWAADQDPEFRQYFYEVLLQDLKGRGKTVIAISHDDRYFSCADQVVTLDYGKLSSIKSHRLPKAVDIALADAAKM